MRRYHIRTQTFLSLFTTFILSYLFVYTPKHARLRTFKHRQHRIFQNDVIIVCVRLTLGRKTTTAVLTYQSRNECDIKMKIKIIRPTHILYFFSDHHTVCQYILQPIIQSANKKERHVFLLFEKHYFPCQNINSFINIFLYFV